MSTCIVNGYILETSNSKKVTKVNERLRVIFNQILKKVLVTNIVSIVSPIANYKYNLKSDCEERHESYLECIQATNHELNNKAFETNVRHKFRNDKGSLFVFSRDIIDLMSTQNIHNMHSVQNEKIYFKTVGNVTLYFFAVSTTVAEEFERINNHHQILKKYEYYDNTDKPDDVTSKSWNHRRHTWNRVLGKSFNASEAMYGIPVKVNFYEISEADLIAELPDENTRLCSIYKRSRMNELGAHLRAEHTKKYGSHMSSSDYSDIFFKSSELVSQEIINGIYMTSQKHLDMMISQEDFIHSIFYQEQPYFKKED